MSRKILSLLLIVFEILIYYFFFNLFDINVGLFRQTLGLFIVYMFIFGHYSIEDTLVWEEIKNVFKACLVYILTFIVVIPQGIHQDKRRYIVFLAMVMFVACIFLSRTLRIVLRHQLKTRTLVMGTSSDSLRYARIANNNRFAITEVLGFVDLNDPDVFKQAFPNVIEEERIPKDRFKVFQYKDVVDVIKKNNINQVVIVENSITEEGYDTIMSTVADLVESVKYMPRDNNTMNFSSQVQDFDGILLISTSRDKMSVFDTIIKRFFDMIFGLIGSILTVFLAIFVKIICLKNGDHDSIFFKQTRIGHHGKEITIYKFRSMIPNAEEKLEELMREDPKIREEYLKNKKLEHDPRITKVGHFLRKSSLDEFPQFFNVLLGDMALVGPRPYLPREKQDMGYYYSNIIEVKPGITGMWQANGRSNLSFEGRCKLDVYYYKNWSLWLDIVIVYKTVRSIIHGTGAM